jgi:lipopolysaccharide export system permease protein
LVGIFVDDRRDPNEHSTYLAEQGEIVKNENGSFLVMQGGSIQRLTAGQRDPRIVTFDRYAFDLSRFTSGPQNAVYTVREKYIWELIWPRPDDALYVTQQGEYRSELFDRLATPLYPLTFAVLAYIFLGPPQTTRQSRSLAMLGMVGTIAALRLVGFVSVIVGVRVPGLLAVQFVALFGTLAASLWQVSRGQAIEPIKIAARIATALTERFARATAS